MINSIQDIQQLVISGFNNWKEYGKVNARKQGDLIIFNYTQEAQFEGTWNYFELVSRGLILNSKTGEIVARPFDKFFNWGESERYSTGKIVTVTEKLDGSLGILYYDNGYKIATRGSFESEQALWATDFINKNHDLSKIPEHLTLLFEIIYPDNRVVINYNGKEDLVLLSARWKKTGRYVPFEELEQFALLNEYSLPKVYKFNTPEQIIEAAKNLDPNSEGWVVEFDDGQRFKFKGDEYKKLHRLVSALSFKNTLECIQSGTINQLIEVIPDEFLIEVKGWIEEIQQTVEVTQNKINELFELAPKSNRKDFALWVTGNHKSFAPYLFAKLDNKPIEPMIYKIEFQKKVESEAF